MDNQYYITSELMDPKPGKDKAGPDAEYDGLHCNSVWIVVKSLKVNKDNKVSFFVLRVVFELNKFDD